MGCFRRHVIASLAAATLCAASPAMAEDRAVIVGINVYQYRPDSNLNAARDDAIRFRNFVRDDLGLGEDQITLLVDQSATREAVVGALLADLKVNTDPGDRLIFYFSGHGAQLPDRTGDEEDGLDEFIFLSDFGKSDRLGVLLDDELRYIFEAFPDRRILVVVDSCYSGTISRGEWNTDELVRALSLSQDEIPRPPASWGTATDAAGKWSQTVIPGQAHMDVWSAVSQTQVAIETPAGGIFTGLFLKGLQQGEADRNGNGRVSNAELLAYVRSGSLAYCRRSKLCQARNKGQLTPEFGGRIERVAAFMSPPVQTSPVPSPTQEFDVQPVPDADSDNGTVVSQAPGLGALPLPQGAAAVEVSETDAVPPSQTPLNDTAAGPVALPARASVTGVAEPQASGSGDGQQPQTAPLPETSQSQTPESVFESLPIPEPDRPYDVVEVTDPDAYLSQPPQQTPVNDTMGDSIPLAPGIVPSPPQKPEPILTCEALRRTDGTQLLSDLFLPDANAALRLTIDPGQRLRLGDRVNFDMAADRDGEIVLFDLNPDCELFQIFPSLLSPQGAEIVDGKRRVSVPSALSVNGRPLEIEVTEPVGRGHLVAILVEDDITRITDELPGRVNLDPIPDGLNQLTDLATDLNMSLNEPNGTRPSRWHATVVPYTITR